MRHFVVCCVAEIHKHPRAIPPCQTHHTKQHKALDSDRDTTISLVPEQPREQPLFGFDISFMGTRHRKISLHFFARTKKKTTDTNLEFEFEE